MGAGIGHARARDHAEGIGPAMAALRRARGYLRGQLWRLPRLHPPRPAEIAVWPLLRPEHQGGRHARGRGGGATGAALAGLHALREVLGLAAPGGGDRVQAGPHRRPLRSAQQLEVQAQPRDPEVPPAPVHGQEAKPGRPLGAHPLLCRRGRVPEVQGVRHEVHPAALRLRCLDLLLGPVAVLRQHGARLLLHALFRVLPGEPGEAGGHADGAHHPVVLLGDREAGPLVHLRERALHAAVEAPRRSDVAAQPAGQVPHGPPAHDPRRHRRAHRGGGRVRGAPRPDVPQEPAPAGAAAARGPRRGLRGRRSVRGGRGGRGPRPRGQGVHLVRPLRARRDAHLHPGDARALRRVLLEHVLRAQRGLPLLLCPLRLRPRGCRDHAPRAGGLPRGGGCALLVRAVLPRQGGVLPQPSVLGRQLGANALLCEEGRRAQARAREVLLCEPTDLALS
mmetsp:Transcript_43545/g.117447  ORF Transcript_43545/g.117447 Transcript_43545/m.117447 type:complete len:450 (+) Transcript_43545:97-1446(+)